MFLYYTISIFCGIKITVHEKDSLQFSQFPPPFYECQEKVQDEEGL